LQILAAVFKEAYFYLDKLGLLFKLMAVAQVTFPKRFITFTDYDSISFLRTLTEDAIIFQTFLTLDRTSLSEKSLITSVLLATAQKKAVPNATFQNRPPKGHAPSGATAIAATQIPSFSVKRI